MNKLQRIAKNTALLFLAQIISYLLAFFYTIYSARYLGVAGFGILSFALAFVSIFGVLGDMGLGTLAVREVAREKSVASKYLVNMLSLKILLALLTALIIIIAINLLNYPSETIYAVYWAALFIIFTTISQIFYSIFQAHEKMEYQSIGTILNSIILFAGVFYAIKMGFNAAGFAAIYAVASAAVLVFCFLICYWKFFVPRMEFDWSFLKPVIREAWPFAVSGLFITIYFWIDSVILSLIHGNEAVGYYNVAYRLLLVLLVIPTILNIAVFPVMSQYYVSAKDSLKIAYEKYFIYMFMVGVPIGVGVTLLANDLILTFFGAQYTNSILALQILVWASVLIFMGSSIARLLESSNKQLIITKMTAICAVLNIILCLTLIPTYSYIGASIATVLTEFAGLILGFMVLSRVGYGFSRKNIISAIKIVIAGLIMGIFIVSFHYLNIFILVLGGVVVYALGLYLLRTFDEIDIQIIKRIIGNRINWAKDEEIK